MKKGKEYSKVSSKISLFLVVVFILSMFSSCVHKHTYKESIIMPTCKNQGYTLYKCECGAEYKDNFVAASHDYVSVVVLPTCTEFGYTTYICKKCGDEYKDNETKALGHNYKQTIVKATCTSKGYTLHKCEKCGNEYLDEEENALGHDYEQSVVKPTCINNGYTLFTCKKCGDKYKNNETNALGHSYDSSVTKPATINSTGIKNYKCSICGDTYSEIIPKVETDWKIEDILDEFGDKTGKKRLIGTFIGTYKPANSANKYACKITATVHFSNGEYDFFFEYAYIGTSAYYMVTEAKSGSLTTKNIDKTQKKYSLTGGSVIPYNYSATQPGANVLVNDIKNNEQIECVMYTSYADRTYYFTMNNAGFTDLCKEFFG